MTVTTRLATILATLAAVLFVAKAEEGSFAQTSPTVSIDAVPDAGNTATSVGSIAVCRQTTVGAAFNVDMVIEGVTGLVGMEAHLRYNASGARITGATYTWLLATGGSNLITLGDSLPDTDGDFHFGAVTNPLSEKSGSGVLARFTIETLSAGTSSLALTGVKLPTKMGRVTPANPQGVYVGPVWNGMLGVEVPCPADADGDTVPDASDVCPNSATGSPVDENGCSQLQVDGDLDRACDPGKVSVMCTGTDNCPAVANPDQANADGDSLGDACDLGDSDGDFLIDQTEYYCGSPPGDGSKRPERLDLTGDDDGDTAIDEALPSPGSDGFDCDGDGWTGNQENLIYLNAPSTARDQDPCGNNGWPADLDPDNKMNIGDINGFIAPARPVNDGHGTFNKFGHPLDDTPPFGVSVDAAMARWNLDTAPHTPTTLIDVGDLNAINPGVSAPTARPPMLGGQPAFFINGGQCPWPQ